MTKPWITIPTTLETIQYRASPLGNCNVKNPNINGIIHSIMRLVDSWRASAAGMVVIFCIRNIDAPTKTGSTKGSEESCDDAPRSIHRKWLSIGMTWWTGGSQV